MKPITGLKILIVGRLSVTTREAAL